MKVFQVNSNSYVSFDKPWGKKVTPQTMKDSLAKFFQNGKENRFELISAFIEKLLKIQEWVNSQKEVRVYSSSLLFLYDGDVSNSKVDIKMIDFAHVHDIKDGGKDEGYILGMKNLLTHMNSLKKK